MTVDAPTTRCAPFVLALLLTGVDAAAELPPLTDTGHDNQLGLVFTPDGATAYWVAWNGQWGAGDGSAQVILQSLKTATGWTRPVPAPFSGRYADSDPFVSPDGRWLYFVSERPTAAGEPAGNADIWRFRLTADLPPEHLAINSPADEYSPVVTQSGTLYFASARDGGKGQGDLYCAIAAGDGFAAPVPLSALNTATGEWNLWVSPDESMLIFEASGRPTNVSTPGDLYFSRRTDAGWQDAVPVRPLNTRNSDLMPRPDRAMKILYYTTAPIGGHARVVATDWPSLLRRHGHLPDSQPEKDDRRSRRPGR